MSILIARSAVIGLRTSVMICTVEITFSFVGYLLGLNCNNTSHFVEILKVINRDLALGLDDSHNSNVYVTPVSPKPIQKPESPQKSEATQQFEQQPERFLVGLRLLKPVLFRLR
jgi:hypothetical protein